MKMLALASLLFAFAVTGCAEPTDPSYIPEAHLKDGSVSFLLFHDDPSPGSVTVDVWKTGHTPGHNAAKTSDCVRLSDDTTISANGTLGTLDTPGSFDDGDLGFETNCEDPLLDAPLDPSATSIDLAIDDGSATKHVVLEKDALGGYAFTRCDVDACDWFR